MPSGMGEAAHAVIESLREQLAAALALAAEVARIKAVNADLEACNALLELQNEKMPRSFRPALRAHAPSARPDGADL